MAIKPASLPFQEAIGFFRQKINLPTETWTDIWQGMHARAFVVAGAMKDELLTDFRVAVDKAIAEGTTIEDFRKDFDGIVKRHGWSYKGGRGWRSRVIYETNIRTAYSAGRYKQQMDPDVLRRRPYFQYKHGDPANPRPLHQSWDGLVLRADDPWWRTHYTPNGWGCTCTVHSLSQADVERLGKTGPDKAPDDGSFVWKDPKTGKRHTVPKGIDPGWAYNPGEAAWGRPVADQVMQDWAATGQSPWERLTEGDWQTHGRPELIPLDPLPAPLAKPVGPTHFVDQIRSVLGGDERMYQFPAGRFTYSVNAVAKTLADHIDPARSPYVPLLPFVMAEPFEVWLSFERHRVTGQVVLRHRVLRAFATGNKEGMMLVAQAMRGQMESWTFVPVKSLKYLARQRVGRLIWAR